MTDDDLREACDRLRAAHPMLSDLDDEQLLYGAMPLLKAGDKTEPTTDELCERIDRLARALSR